jgi:hypothetical protein
MRSGTPCRLRLILLLPLLMLWAQQGAWLHQLGHVSYSAQPHQALAKGSDHDFDNDRCPTCQAFSQVSFSATSELPQVAFIAPSLLKSPKPHFIILAIERPTPRSRGPPSV